MHAYTGHQLLALRLLATKNEIVVIIRGKDCQPTTLSLPSVGASLAGIVLRSSRSHTSQHQEFHNAFSVARSDSRQPLRIQWQVCRPKEYQRPVHGQHLFDFCGWAIIAFRQHLLVHQRSSETFEMRSSWVRRFHPGISVQFGFVQRHGSPCVERQDTLFFRPERSKLNDQLVESAD
jgi:hypothetical protein